MNNVTKEQLEKIADLLERFHKDLNDLYGCYQEVVVLTHEKDHEGPCRGAMVMSPENFSRVYDIINLGLLSAAKYMHENTVPPNTNLN